MIAMLIAEVTIEISYKKLPIFTLGQFSKDKKCKSHHDYIRLHHYDSMLDF